ncbi:MAG: bifunctional hydroxymethylpyrimidine kinase/phosphomethylpyrimidine kinase [Lautropia sp.]|nr:bifunctional hydroxymethylpyrimidine kinase/phosphomethylpyrimidine kinase [Lautropia sp.]
MNEAPALSPAPTAGELVPNVLSIAGTDPTGGAGIQTDLKVFGALGSYGMAVITAVIAQNTERVQRVQAVDADLVGEQLDCVFEDVRVDAVKIGMVGNADIAAAIASRLSHYRPARVVFDPVMIASTNRRLMNEVDLQRIREALLPHVGLLTPNLTEAGLLLGRPPAQDEAGMRAMLTDLHALGVANVLLKGGHLSGEEAVDLLSTPSGVMRLTQPRLHTRHGHGTGCTLSSAIAAYWTRHSLPESVSLAKHYLHRALQQAERLSVGHGSGPLHHFHAIW